MNDLKLEMESPTVTAILRAYEEAHDESERYYLGCSIIGDACQAKLWFGFRWANRPEQFDGRMLRLFATGHREEERMIDDLRRAGVTVFDREPDGNQIGVSAIGGHFKGHLDGVGLGIVEAPKTPHVLEFKTYNAKTFALLKKSGVREAKPLHYAQIQIYMKLLDISRAFYLAHCKDTDELHAERIHADPGYGDLILEKAERIITSPNPPVKLHENPASKMAFACRYCPSLGVCHEGEMPRRNCRTCLESSPLLDGDARWHCAFHDTDLSIDDQRKGCREHRFLPGLIKGTQTDVDTENRTISYEMMDGSIWIDGVTDHV